MVHSDFAILDATLALSEISFDKKRMCKHPAHRKTESEIRQGLMDQIQLLRISCANFDAGIEAEGKRIATQCYILVHDPERGKSKSVLKQAGLKETIRFADSRNDRFNTEYSINIGPPLLCLFKKNNSLKYVAPLNDRGSLSLPDWLEFKDWWNGKIYFNASGKSLSRKNLIMSIRDQDGGAHFDETLENSEYVEMKHNPKPVNFSTNSRYLAYANINQNNIHLLSVRQIGWELDQSLIRIGL